MENKEGEPHIRYKPFLETKPTSTYQKGNKTLIITKKEITFQTNDKILKRKNGKQKALKQVSL